MGNTWNSVTPKYEILVINGENVLRVCQPGGPLISKLGFQLADVNLCDLCIQWVTVRSIAAARHEYLQLILRALVYHAVVRRPKSDDCAGGFGTQ